METLEKFGIIGVILFFVLLIGLKLFISERRCLTSYENYQPAWGIFSGCRITFEGKLTPVDIVREIK